MICTVHISLGFTFLVLKTKLAKVMEFGKLCNYLAYLKKKKTLSISIENSTVSFYIHDVLPRCCLVVVYEEYNSSKAIQRV